MPAEVGMVVAGRLFDRINVRLTEMVNDGRLGIAAYFRLTEAVRESIAAEITYCSSDAGPAEPTKGGTRC